MKEHFGVYNEENVILQSIYVYPQGLTLSPSGSKIPCARGALNAHQMECLPDAKTQI